MFTIFVFRSVGWDEDSVRADSTAGVQTQVHDGETGEGCADWRNWREQPNTIPCQSSQHGRQCESLNNYCLVQMFIKLQLTLNFTSVHVDLNKPNYLVIPTWWNDCSLAFYLHNYIKSVGLTWSTSKRKPEVGHGGYISADVCLSIIKAKSSSSGMVWSQLM